MSREPFDAATVPALSSAQFVSGNEQMPAAPRKGRRRKHADDAARVAAYREANARLELVTNKRIANTVASLAEQFDTSKNEVLNSLLRFALTNRNWRQQGLYGCAAPEEKQ